jgi:hypothetical protein
MPVPNIGLLQVGVHLFLYFISFHYLYFRLTTGALKTPPASSQITLGTSIFKLNMKTLTVEAKTALNKDRYFSFHSKTEIYFLNRIYALPFGLYFFSSLYFWVFYGISTIISPSAIPSPAAYNRANCFYNCLLCGHFLAYFF